ncbi:MAG: phosphotransferase [Oscillospiraceae bacterium]|nr:phosphotransferase [Oscillospiraceae bacterium]
MSDLTYDSALNADELTIIVGGRADSDNSRELSEYFAEECKQAHGYLTLDLENLEYISSAGLRVLLSVIKKEPKRVKAVNVRPEVYDILEMTGFSQMLDTSRAMRRVSVDGCEKIGQGGQGSVYRLDKDTIIKVFSPQMPLEEIEKERSSAQKAFMRGIPTAISYDIVKCGDSFGVVYEMLNADTVAALINKEPDKLEDYVKEYAKMVKKAHGVDMSGSGFPDVKAMRGGGFELAYMNGMLSREQADGCARLFNTLPERTTFLHGDINPNNVMMQDGEMLLIDMGAAGYGHPLIDVASIYLTTGFMGRQGKSLGDKVTGATNPLSPERSVRIWEIFIREYFGTDDRETLESIEYQCETFTLLTSVFIFTFGAQMGMAPELTESSRRMCEKMLFPKIEERLRNIKPDGKLRGDYADAAAQTGEKTPEAQEQKKSLLDKILGKRKKPEASAAKLITADSKIRDIIENEAAKSILERNIPGITENSQLKMAYGMTLRALQKFPQAKISKERLDEIEKEFAGL